MKMLNIGLMQDTIHKFFNAPRFEVHAVSDRGNTIVTHWNTLKEALSYSRVIGQVGYPVSIRDIQTHKSFIFSKMCK